MIVVVVPNMCKFLFFFVKIVSLIKFFYTTLFGSRSLFPSIEWMTLGAYLNLIDSGTGRSRLKGVTANTGNLYLFIFRVNSFFHLYLLLQIITSKFRKALFFSKVTLSTDLCFSGISKKNQNYYVLFKEVTG